MLPGVLPVVDEHYRQMRRIEATALALARRAWGRVDPANLLASWDREAARMLSAFTRQQFQAATEGASYTAETLRAQGIPTAPEGVFIPESLMGWASDGRPLESLLQAPASVAFAHLTTGAGPAVALDAGRVSLDRIARTQIADAGRVAAGIDIATRPKVGWTRMLTGSSCARCIALAGRVYRWSDGFERHPQDDCIHVPTKVNLGRYDVVTDPRKYFDSLSATEQDRRFTKDGAKAIRDGADIGQVVNARRGMSTTAGFQTTTEGATSHGLAGQRLGAKRGQVATRLVPETIYSEASDRAHALRLLKQHGYIR